MEILVEGPAKHQNLAKGEETGNPAAGHQSVWSGRTPCNRVVNFLADPGRDLTGRFLDVTITSATSLSLYGELIVDPCLAEGLA
jgi:hypothetical protein